jgi:hypothetical protein
LKNVGPKKINVFICNKVLGPVKIGEIEINKSIMIKITAIFATYQEYERLFRVLFIAFF